MREIKFRIYNKEKKHWCDMRAASLESSGGREIYIPVFLAIREENEVMQFTGLKDKNGKEIYEGDILDCGVRKLLTPDPNNFGGYIPSSKKIIEIVEWHESATGFTPFMSFTDEGVDPKESEIIGNIYENPELLK